MTLESDILKVFYPVFVILLFVCILFSICYIIIKIYKHKQAAIKKQEENERLKEIKKQAAIQKQKEIKWKVEIKTYKPHEQPMVIKKQKDKAKYETSCNKILLKIIVECRNNKLEHINNIIKKMIINKDIYTDKLDKHTIYDINDIFNNASFIHQIEFIQVIYSLDNIKNKQYLSDNIFIRNENTYYVLLKYALNFNKKDLLNYVIKFKSDRPINVLI